MRRIANRWELMKSSWRILMRDKALLILPLISGVAGLLVLAALFLPFMSTVPGGWHGDANPTFATYVIGFFHYLCSFFVIYFCNAALVDYVVTRLRGDEHSLGTSVREAVSCAPQLAVWAAEGIFGVVLYLCTKTGKVPEGFSARNLRSAIAAA